MSESNSREQQEPRPTEDSCGTSSVDNHLADSAERNQLLIDSMVEGLALHEIILDEHGAPCDYRFLEVNPAFEILTGLKREDVIGHTVLEVMPGTEPVWIERYGAVAMTGTPARFEDYASELDKHFGIVAYSPQPGQFAAIISDITERVCAREILHQSEQRLAVLFDRAPLGYQSLDEDGRFIEVNPAWLEALGYEREEVIGAWFGDFLAPEYAEAFRTRFPLFKERGAIHSEFPMMHKDGSQHEISFEGRIGYNSDGSFKQTHCILSDITERKQVEEALRKEHELYLDLVDSVTSGVYRIRVCPREQWAEDAWVNPEHSPVSVEFFSDRFCELLGIDRQVYQDNPGIVEGSVHPEDREDFSRINVAANVGMVPFLWEGRLIVQGEVLWARFESTPRLIADGSILWTGTTYDITERKKIDAELMHLNENLENLVEERAAEAVQANRAKSEFLASMSHEFRTPLNSIIGFSGIMLDGMAGEVSEEQRRQLSMIQASGKRLLGLVNDILDLSKIEAQTVSVDLRETNVMQICSDALEQVRPQFEEKGIELRFSPCKAECTHCGRAMLDQEKLTQIVLNLLSNAVKFTEHGSVECRIDCAGENTMLVRVTDTGVGIEKDALEHIFDEFEQIPMKGQAKPHGTGLGLPISRKLAHLLGGSLTVTSTPGSGSEFTLQLPLHFADGSHE